MVYLSFIYFKAVVGAILALARFIENKFTVGAILALALFYTTISSQPPGFASISLSHHSITLANPFALSGYLLMTL